MRFIGEIKPGGIKVLKIICNICYSAVDPSETSERGYCADCDALFREKAEQVH